MPLNPTQLAVVVDWLKTHGGALICPVCSWQKFEINNHLVTNWPISYVPDGGHRLRKQYPSPLVMVTCHHCGNVRYFSAVVIGIVPANQAPVSEEGESLAETVQKLVKRYGDEAVREALDRLRSEAG